MNMPTLRRPTALLALLLFARAASADTIYSNFQNLTIPNTQDGIFLDIDTSTTGSAAFTGWDINPFFSGEAIANSPAFQPVRIGTSNLDRVLNLAPGTVISGSLTYASGFGGSGEPPNTHLGAGPDQFQNGVEGYLGFKFTTNGGSGTNYGWMRVKLALDLAIAKIMDWAYDNSGGAIVIGRVEQSAAELGLQTVTLSPQTGESFTLGSAIIDSGSNTNRLIKIGAGTTKIETVNTFTGSTTISGGTLEVSAEGALGHTSGITVDSGGTLLLSGPGNVDRINNAAGVTLAGGTIAFSGNVTEGPSPGMGALTLSANSVIDFAGGNAVMNFGASGAAAWAPGAVLSIYNWDGLVNGGGNDRLFFGSASDSASLTSAQLGQISFFSGGPGSIFLGNAGFDGMPGEIVPVPEPSSLIYSLGLIGLAGWRLRLQRRHKPSA